MKESFKKSKWQSICSNSKIDKVKIVKKTFRPSLIYVIRHGNNVVSPLGTKLGGRVHLISGD